MAITNAQQYKQLLANGGRIGLQGGGRDIMPETNAPSQDRIAEIKQANEVIDRLEKDKAQEPFETLTIKDSNVPGIGGMVLNALKSPRQNFLNKNVDFYRSDPRTQKARTKYGLDAEGYRQYMADRQAGKIDAAGNITDEANAINPRITDINLYFKDITGQDTSDHVGLGSLGEWFLLGTGSYITGKFKIISSGREIEAFPIFHNSSSVHDLMSWSIMAPDVGDAPNIVSYEANAGLASGTTSTEAIYKTSVVANGRLYAGNIELVEGNGKGTRLADALVRSPISAFDILPNTYCRGKC